MSDSCDSTCVIVFFLHGGSDSSDDCRYVENGSLANIIKPNKFGPFPESLAAVYIAQVNIW